MAPSLALPCRTHTWRTAQYRKAAAPHSWSSIRTVLRRSPCLHAGTAGRARRQETPFPGALESLAECADPSRPHSEWHLYLLGFANLSTQARSGYGKRRCGGGDWNLDMRPRAWPASLQQSTRLDLQPHGPWAGHVGASPAPALGLRVALRPEWHRVRAAV